MDSPQRNLHQPDESEDVYTNRHSAGAGSPRKHKKLSEIEAHPDRLSDSDSDTILGHEQVRQEGPVGQENKPQLDGIYGDDSKPSAREERGKTATTGRRAYTEPTLPPASSSNINISPSSSQLRPQPSSQPDSGQNCGRYNAGVRALRSPRTPRRSNQANNGHAHPYPGRYNMGVRAPRSQEGPSPQSEIHTDKTSEPIDSASSRPEEDKLVPRCSRPT
ncbi:MAG: hypothetical protein Q9175_004832 [Cornicularia normoerica]